MQLPSDPVTSTSLLRSAVEQANDSVIITGNQLDPPGPKILYVNPAFTDITGYTPQDVRGKTPRLLQGPLTEPWVVRRLRTHLENGEPFEGEAINYRKDGTPFVNHWSIAPVRDGSGIITHWVSVQRDVTDRRQMSERMLEVQERERHDTAREIHDELGGLLASLQMTLNRVRLQSDRASAARAPLDDLESQIESLSSVVRSLTDQASPQVLRDFGLSEALSELVTDLGASWNLQITLHNELGPGNQLSPLLEHVVYRVLQEALSNVGRHADAEEVELLLQKTDGQLRLRIVDDGTGFDPETDIDRGAHYGLTSIRERVEKLNGTLDLCTARGEGTRITITLPPILASHL
jgi:PAS domain S-box-containing protein